MQVRHGTGRYTYASRVAEDAEPDYYEGDWKDNEKNGIGIQTYEGVGKYHGYWVDGKRDGEGVMTYTSQDIYSGNWVQGEKDGQGTYIFNKTGEKYVGTFKTGQLVQGQWRYPNGSYFEGNFDFNKPKGAGQWKFTNGNTVEGTYTQTKRADVDGDEIKLAWKTTGDITKSPAAAAF